MSALLTEFAQEAQVMPATLSSMVSMMMLRWFQWWCPDWSTDFGRLRSSDWRAGEPPSSPRGG
ncbi:hypothetical protein ABB22_11720 [Stenotrophomonas nitritireducens]|uniref:Uncharacterized protein n=1 Tax=Stenotrophomonas nitritireducens TaxID=83617 RepID=A0ABR5NIG9_9GAMM|nr:hypothetical protein ABB22_11720 [Stenotrophomonas nitritireducens]